MTALLTENMALLAGAPDGVKRLRDLIVELAVNGKLLPQDLDDEPAAIQLARIAKERATSGFRQRSPGRDEETGPVGQRQPAWPVKRQTSWPVGWG
jgi:type I restriction enzyme S subunit